MFSSVLIVHIAFSADQVNRALDATNIRPSFIGARVLDISPPATVSASDGVVFPVDITLEEDYDGSAVDIVQELWQSIVNANYSVGNTDLYVDRLNFTINYRGD